MNTIPIPNHHNEILQAMQLYRSPRIGPRSYFKLLQKEGRFDTLLARLEETVSKQKISDYAPATLDAVEREYESGRNLGAQLVFYGATLYPKSLLNNPEAPAFLWLKGDMKLLRRRSIALIGSRNPTIEGVQIARHLGRETAQNGVTVISGLARGIDTAAHEGALAGGTVGVVAGGVDVFYPKSNERLQANIAERGLLVSEMPIGHQPQANNFPQRNRIIAGLAELVIVVEAGLRSGTKITVNEALALGREIAAVPGHPFAPLSALPNQLIREGAGLIRELSDILELLKIDPSHNAKPAPLGAAERFVKQNPDQNETDRRATSQSLAGIGKALLEGRAARAPDGSFYMLDQDQTRK